MNIEFDQTTDGIDSCRLLPQLFLLRSSCESTCGELILAISYPQFIIMSVKKKKEMNDMHIPPSPQSTKRKDYAVHLRSYADEKWR